jgi:4a-hydroxytetrahydrobiopterin dehydratase
MKCAVGGQATALGDGEIAQHLASLSGWQREGPALHKSYQFKNYHETLAFVNAGAWISHREDHHPDLGVHFNRCEVSYSTHDAGGITLNDFICAAKLDALFTS